MKSSDTPIERIPVSLQPGIAMIICMGGILITGLVSGAYHYIFSLVQ